MSQKIGIKQESLIFSTEEEDEISRLSEKLPGGNELIPNPCYHVCTVADFWFNITELYISSIIIHWNDDHGMSREEIADRLEAMDIDMEFK